MMEPLSDHAIETRIKLKNLNRALRFTFSKWKSVTKYNQSFRSFQEEHQVRKNRIDSLLGRLSNLAVSDDKDVNVNRSSSSRSNPRQLSFNRLKKQSSQVDDQNPQYTGRINEYLSQLGEKSPDMYSRKNDAKSSPSSSSITSRPSKMDSSSFEKFSSNHSNVHSANTQQIPQQQLVTSTKGMATNRPPVSEVTARSHSSLRPKQRSNSFQTPLDSSQPYSPSSSGSQQQQRKSGTLTSRSNPDNVVSNSTFSKRSSSSSSSSSSARKPSTVSSFGSSTKTPTEHATIRANSVSNVSASRMKVQSSGTASSSVNSHHNNTNRDGMLHIRPKTNHDSGIISKSPTSEATALKHRNSNSIYNSNTTNSDSKRHFFPNAESNNDAINHGLMPNISRSGISTSSGATLSSSSSSSSSDAYESRAAERWERTNALRKQAEERIAQKKREEEKIALQRVEEEMKDADLLREQKRIELATKRRKHTGEAMTTNGTASSTINGADEGPHQLQLARKHYKRQLLVNWGLVPWMKLCQQARQQKHIAMNHYNHHLLRMCWYNLQGYLKNIRFEKYKIDMKNSSLVLSHYRRTLCRHVWKKWKSYGKFLRAKALAVWKKSSKHSILMRTLTTWKISLERSRRKNLQKWQSAGMRGEIVLKRYYWSVWLNWIRENNILKEIDKRTELTWNKVQKWLN